MKIKIRCARKSLQKPWSSQIVFCFWLSIVAIQLLVLIWRTTYIREPIHFFLCSHIQTTFIGTTEGDRMVFPDYPLLQRRNNKSFRPICFTPWLQHPSILTGTSTNHSKPALHKVHSTCTSKSKLLSLCFMKAILERIHCNFNQGFFCFVLWFFLLLFFIDWLTSLLSWLQYKSSTYFHTIQIRSSRPSHDEQHGVSQAGYSCHRYLLSMLFCCSQNWYHLFVKGNLIIQRGLWENMHLFSKG